MKYLPFIITGISIAMSIASILISIKTIRRNNRRKRNFIIWKQGRNDNVVVDNFVSKEKLGFLNNFQSDVTVLTHSNLTIEQYPSHTEKFKIKVEYAPEPKQNDESK
jgi:cell shape-determining protein MreC